MQRGAVGFQVTLDVEGRRALVIGGGEVAADKVERLLDGEARIVVVSRELVPSLAARVEAGAVEWRARCAEPADYEGADLILLCEHDPVAAASAFDAATAQRALAWCHDDPPRSHFAMPALARVGRARVAISTAGAAPGVAGALRAALERDLGERFGAFIAWLGAARERLRGEIADQHERRRQLGELASGFQVRVSASYPASYSATGAANVPGSEPGGTPPRRR